MDYWHRQTIDEPLFTELLWSRPENKRHAGKLAIIGGNKFGFSAVGEAFNAAVLAGIGVARVLLPDSLRKTVLPLMPEAEFGSNNPSGSFSQQALIEFLDISKWADSTLLAGDLGKNSETAIVLEKFAKDYSGSLVITKDAVDYFTSRSELIIDRPDTTVVLSLAQLQKLFQHTKSTSPITFGMDFLRLVQVLHEFTSKHRLEIVVKHLDTIFVAVSGEVSTTKLIVDKPVWRVLMAATVGVWRIQNPNRVFEALTVGICVANVSHKDSSN